jgi:hypothetical protein
VKHEQRLHAEKFINDILLEGSSVHYADIQRELMRLWSYNITSLVFIITVPLQASSFPQEQYNVHPNTFVPPVSSPQMAYNSGHDSVEVMFKCLIAN